MPWASEIDKTDKAHGVPMITGRDVSSATERTTGVILAKRLAFITDP
jgi:hypothetical protein